jgi:hypothetical protein
MRLSKQKLFVLALVAVSLGVPATARAHCDSLDGPVIADARRAVETGRVNPVLKWVRETDETEIRRTLDRVLQVRALGAEARELADRHFFETLVRVHRATEGAPYTGLMPAVSVEPGIQAADRALESGNVDALVDAVTARVARELRERFAEARAARTTKENGAAKGREYVRRYVEFVHYVEAIHHAGAHDHDHGG